MTHLDLLLLSPYLVLGAASIIVLMGAAFLRNTAIVMGLTCAGLAAAFFACVWIAPMAPHDVTVLLIVDRYALFYVGLILVCSFAVALMFYGSVVNREPPHEEFFVFLLLATLGAAVLVSSSHFASFFLGLELLSVSLYTMVAYRRAERRGIEAGIKYLVLAAVTAAFLLFGMALVYADIGTMELGRVAARLSAQGAPAPLSTIGLGLILVGVGFKLALVPFHLWTPDIYQGAPIPAAAFIATVSKIGVFALVMRYYGSAVGNSAGAMAVVLWSVAIASMFIGNLLALLQDNVKRILAYSSIAHMGYFLVAFLSGSRFGIIAATYYLVAYALTILGAFSAIALLSKENGAEDLSDLRSLAYRSPMLAGAITVSFVSLAGIPITAGFIGKFYVFAAGVQGQAWPLVASLLVSSSIGLFYYLRVVAVLYKPVLPIGGAAALPAGVASAMPIKSLSTCLALWTALGALIVLGIFPGPLTDLIHAAIAGP